MTSRILSRYDDAALNCFTGSFVALAERRGTRLTEQMLFEHGDCFLFQAGRDESGLPEYIFPVEEAGVLGMQRMNATVETTRHADTDGLAGQVRDLLDEHGQLITWVNTRHLGYADVYARTAPYLHSVVVHAMDDSARTVSVFDCMVADTERYSCEAELDWQDFERAATDWIRSDAHDCMGRFYTADTGQVGVRTTTRERVAGQAARFAAEERFHLALSQYAALNAAWFETDSPRARTAGRRLFDHSTVLYAIPSLSLLARSLTDCDDIGRAPALVQEAIQHWRAVGVLGLRFEATGSPRLAARLAQRFEDLDGVVRQLWQELA